MIGRNPLIMGTENRVARCEMRGAGYALRVV